jgi:hypothetical protein
MSEVKKLKKAKTEAKPEGELKGWRKWKAKMAERQAQWEKSGGVFESGAENPLDIPQDVLKAYEREGFSFAWVRESCMGQPDPKNVALHERNQWQAVQPGDFEDIPVTSEGGLILMVRPKAIDDKARRMEQAAASAPVTTMHMKMGEGDLPGVTMDARGARRSNFMRKSIEKIEIPKD